MKHKKFLAIGSALLLIAGLFSTGAGAAIAGGGSDNTNSADYWQAQYPNAVSCYKYDSNGGAHGTVTNGGNAVTLNAFQQAWPGDRWEVLIVKGGSVDTGSGPGNVVYNLPSAGVAYFAPTNAGGQQAAVSHWIVCKGQTPVQNDASAAISFTAPTCDVDQKLVLGSVVNATWGTVTYSGEGNRNFSVTATATAGHKFSDGSASKTFTGTLLAATGGCTPPPCLPKSAVSYTYDSVTNSGVITVKAMDGYSNELCKPFWVTAASWTFDGNTMWPQTLDQWNPANGGNAISSVGVYPYAAPVNCGQGDIYATFTAPGVPATTGVLYGPSDPYKEHFLHQMGFSGPNPTYTVQDAAACYEEVIPSLAAVTFVDECGTANDKVNVPTKLGVIYTTVDGRDANGVGTVTVTATAAPGYVFDGSIRSTSWSHDFTNEPCLVEVPVVPAASFTDLCATTDDDVTVPTQTGVVYSTVDGRDANGVGTVTVTAAAAAGYVFASSVTTTSWSHDFTNEPCPTVEPIAPKAVDPTCVADEGGVGVDPIVTSGYIELDLKAHLYYSIDGVPTSAAKNDVEPGEHTVSVTVDDGYTLVGPSEWTLTVNPPFCPPTLALLSTSASMTDATCTAKGSYTLADTEGIQWFVNGSSTPTAAGTYQVDGAQTVNVEAQLIDPINDGWEDDAQQFWTFPFTDPSDCLPTLAFTGSTGNTLGLLLAGGLLLFGGAAIAFERTFRFNAK